MTATEPTPHPDCGTPRRYRAHRRANEKACDACLLAHSRYMKQWRLRTQQREAMSADALGCQRRVQALRRIGWSTDHIAAAAGVGNGTIHRLLNGTTTTMRMDTLDRIRAVYERLSMKPGPSATSARHAAEAGHPPPLAWDDIDNPDERPKGVIGQQARRPTAKRKKAA